MKTTIEIINRMSKNINRSSNDMQYTPYWNKLKALIKKYNKEVKITEINTNDAIVLYGLNKENCFKMLIEINKELFEKK